MKFMKINFLLLLPFILYLTLSGCSKHESVSIYSPDRKIRVNVGIDKNGSPFYMIFYADSLVLKESKLGIIRADEDFSKSMQIKEISEVSMVKDEYILHADKKNICKYFANKQCVIFSNDHKNEMTVIFQVSNDGVAFRYYFENKTNETKIITEEKTSFHFPASARAWLHPHTDAHTGWEHSQPSYEELYQQEVPVGQDAPFKAGWSFPALFKSNDCWLLITETDMSRSYCGSRLAQHAPKGEYTIAFPQELERTDTLKPVYPESTLPWYSPWRVIMIGKTLAPIVESSLVTDLSSPAKKTDTSFIKPGKASWSWVLLKDDSTIYPVQKKYIDYASKMGWRYCLIDALWDTKIGYEKIKALADYAKTKNVGLILWYNSAGNWNTTPLTPRGLLVNHESRKKEFEKLQFIGIKGIKVDFFGGDGQSFMQYYQDILDDAAKYHLLVNFHGATIPRGWTRTYPNLMSMEAVRGCEFLTFDQSNTDAEANHCTMLPFTRNVIGPMDFTPMCFSEIPDKKRTTTNAFELALSILFQSGIQHYAEKPEGMFSQPDYVIDFIKQIPETWDDIKFLKGYPGKYVVIARKGGNKWFVGGINGQDKPIDLTFDLSVLKSNSNGILITDSVDNRSFTKLILKNNLKDIKLTLKPKGGFVMLLD